MTYTNLLAHTHFDGLLQFQNVVRQVIMSASLYIAFSKSLQASNSFSPAHIETEARAVIDKRLRVLRVYKMLLSPQVSTAFIIFSACILLALQLAVVAAHPRLGYIVTLTPQDEKDTGFYQCRDL